ncbi:hypothetical protein B0H13DRAFT_1859028 [Mycena leptocephala]|nr:hypothetical protein B0H13DRAFT_1859028 [Mycena leptocephala]
MRSAISLISAVLPASLCNDAAAKPPEFNGVKESEIGVSKVLLDPVLSKFEALLKKNLYKSIRTELPLKRLSKLTARECARRSRLFGFADSRRYSSSAQLIFRNEVKSSWEDGRWGSQMSQAVWTGDTVNGDRIESSSSCSLGRPKKGERRGAQPQLWTGGLLEWRDLFSLASFFTIFVYLPAKKGYVSLFYTGKG